jgi:serine/threonine-protein kinase
VAKEAYEEALGIEPRNSTALLNRADSEIELGFEGEAKVLYRRALKLLLEKEKTAELTADDSMAKAQCLARLGLSGMATELAQRTLQQSPGEPLVVYAAALVYSLIGDPTTALVHAKKALRLGMSPNWFRIAAFDSIRGDPELQSLLAAGKLP